MLPEHSQENSALPFAQVSLSSPTPATANESKQRTGWVPVATKQLHSAVWLPLEPILSLHGREESIHGSLLYADFGPEVLFQPNT